MSTPLVIAIDGPSGSGKSSVARGVARSLGLDYLDTGSMYRAMTWFVLSQGADVKDVQTVAELAPEALLEPSTSPEIQHIHVDGTDVTGIIRGELITSLVSQVAANPTVRSLLVARQQEIAAQAKTGIVVEGRDIGSVVLPDAHLKLYITADPIVRASRRAAQSERDLAATQESLLARDHADSTRQASPLELAQDAILLDTTHMDLPEVIEHVLALVAEQS